MINRAIQADPPYVPSKLEHLARLSRVLCNPRKIVDLGCGDGLVLEWFAERYPAATIAGWETDSALASAARSRLSRDALIHESDLWQADVSDADIVYVYLAHHLMPRVLTEIIPRMRAGALLISHMFQLPNDYYYINMGNMFAYPVLRGVGRDDLAGEL